MHPRPGRNGNWRQRPGRNSNLRPRPGGVLLLGAWCRVPCAWRRNQIQLQSQIQIQHPKSADMNRLLFRVGINWNQAGSVSNPSVYEIGIAVCITMQVSRQCQFPWVCGLTYPPSTHHPESSRRGPMMVVAPRQRRKITDTDFMGL